MRWAEPLYTDDKCREHLKEYRHLLENLSETDEKQLDFIVIVSPANEQNLMEMIPASQLKQRYYRPESMMVLGFASNKNEAFEVCRRILQDCFLRYGEVDRKYICPEAENPVSVKKQ